MEIMGTSSKKQEMNSSDKQVLVDIDKLAKELETLRSHPLSDKCCIYRVPERLRELNRKAYTPRVVSIGPFHRGKKKTLGAMEEHKKRYLDDFLQRSKLTLQDLVKATEENETRLKQSYAETIDIPRKEFIKMMMVDSAFIIEYFLKNYFKEYYSNDRVFGKQRMTDDIALDLFLIENQVPFFFLVNLFELSNNDREGLSMIKLVQTVLTSEVGEVDDKKLLEMTSSQVQHLVDFLRISLLPSKPNPNKQYSSLSTPTVTQLHQAGVEFKSGSSKCLLDIQFNKKNGNLEIPKWKITDATEILFRNVQAFEQCHGSDHYLSDYIAIMNFLINVPEDVELLVQNKIIENWMQDNQAVATSINKLDKHNLIGEYFYFSGLIEDLNAYYEIPKHKWKAILKQKYFNNPWTIISVIAASFLLILTVIQSVCSILQVV